jgi:15-cis-phytoene synthase
MTLEQSYAWCTRIARSRARNFYYSFVLLSRPQRDAICALYAFMRYCDDVSDDDTEPERAAKIGRWRDDLDAALTGDLPDHPIWPAFHDAVTRYAIPHHYFHELIEGVSSDLEPRTIHTFDELYRYCYLVASVVGITVLHIFGFDSEEALPLAEECGIAFQLTNILRDVKEDAERGRVYLPAEDLARFRVSAESLNGHDVTPEMRELFRFEAQRAEKYYRSGYALVPLVHPESRPSLWAMIEIYHRLLRKIEHSGFDVLSQRIRLPATEKVWIVVRGFTGQALRT